MRQRLALEISRGLLLRYVEDLETEDPAEVRVLSGLAALLPAYVNGQGTAQVFEDGLERWRKQWRPTKPCNIRSFDEESPGLGADWIHEAALETLEDWAFDLQMLAEQGQVEWVQEKFGVVFPELSAPTVTWDRHDIQTFKTSAVETVGLRWTSRVSKINLRGPRGNLKPRVNLVYLGHERKTIKSILRGSMAPGLTANRGGQGRGNGLRLLAAFLVRYPSLSYREFIATPEGDYPYEDVDPVVHYDERHYQAINKALKTAANAVGLRLIS